MDLELLYIIQNDLKFNPHEISDNLTKKYFERYF